MRRKKVRRARVKISHRECHPQLGPGKLWPWVCGGPHSLSSASWRWIDSYCTPGVLTTFHGLEPLSPLYAFSVPQIFKPTAALLALLALSCGLLLPRLLSPSVSTAWFAVGLLLFVAGAPADTLSRARRFRATRIAVPYLSRRRVL